MSQNILKRDKLWFSQSVWMAKCRWKCWNQEGHYLSNNTHNPTYLQNTINPPEILVNTKLVTDHDANKAKALLINYRQFLTEITPAQKSFWEQIEPKKGKKNAYVPNSVWASKEQLEWQQCYAKYGDSSEPTETFHNVQAKYPGGKVQPAVYCTNNLLSRIPLGTSSLGPTSVCSNMAISTRHTTQSIRWPSPFKLVPKWTTTKSYHLFTCFKWRFLVPILVSENVALLHFQQPL